MLVLLNPGASRVEAIMPELRAWFEARASAHFVDATETDAARELERLGADADLIVIGGGDGTVSKALPLLLKVRKPFAVLPLGTANDFARTIGVPDDPLAAAALALSGRPHAIDVGLVNGKPFLNVASIGAAVKVAEAQSKGMKARWRVFAYALALLQSWRALRPLSVEIDIDGEPAWAGLVYQVSVGNGRFHGGGLVVAEQASIDDGMLDLYLIYPGRAWQLFASLLHLKFRFRRPEVLQRLRGARVRLRTRRPHAVNADGELVTETPAEFAVLSRALKVMVPRKPSAKP